jgi:hypothetical protein
MGSIDEYNQRAKISRYCPFKTSVFTNFFGVSSCEFDRDYYPVYGCEYMCIGLKMCDPGERMCCVCRNVLWPISVVNGTVKGCHGKLRGKHT